MSKKNRLAISLVLVLATVLAFVYYFSKHRYLLANLAHTPLSTVVWVLVLYLVALASILLVLDVSLAICHRKIGVKENLLLNAYGLFVNFFMPGQGGPAVRGLYLKKRYQLKIRDYVFVSLLYYAAYAGVSAFLLLIGSRPWWWTLLGVLVTGSGSWVIVRLYTGRSKTDEAAFDLRPRMLLYLLAATVLQAVIQICIYSVELHAVNPHISFAQTITYTGAANFALFVALTPGAIGIRESFLLFSERLHHLSSSTIVSANVIDRGVYLLFLGVIFALTLSLHAKSSLQIKRLQQAKPSQPSKTE